MSDDDGDDLEFLKAFEDELYNDTLSVGRYVPHYNIRYHVIPHYIVPYHSTPFTTTHHIQYHTTLYHTILKKLSLKTDHPC